MTFEIYQGDATFLVECSAHGTFSRRTHHSPPTVPFIEIGDWKVTEGPQDQKLDEETAQEQITEKLKRRSRR